MDRAEMIVAGIELTAELFMSGSLDYSGIPLSKRGKQITDDYMTLVEAGTPESEIEILERCAYAYIMGM